MGAVAVLALGVIATALMFTAKSGVKGYKPPETGEYYREHPEKLAEEIETVLLPAANISGVSVGIDGGAVAVTGPKKPLDMARRAIITYYDEDLFVFTEVSE